MSRFRQARLAALAAGGTCLAVLLVTPSAPAAALSPPGGFQLRASNGYALTVVSFHKPDTERGEVLVLAHKRNAAVFYFARAIVSDTSIEADLGTVGRIDVDFVPTGEGRLERSECGGRGLDVDSGRYVGVIDFNGEQQYSQADASSARGDAKFTLSLVCSRGLDEGLGGHSPGALLRVRRGAGPRFEFSARKNSPSRVSRFSASISERRGALSIERGVAVEAKPSAFTFDVPGGTATVAPPAPFDGKALYRRQPRGSALWGGDLSVDFPGRADVSLIGAGTHASLVRAVQNPSHPFRLP